MSHPSIISADHSHYPMLMDVWESSVKATHHFLSEEDFSFYKTIIPQAFDQVRLYTMLDDQEEIVGFMGIQAQVLEMLFVKPDYIGKGIGKQLMLFALEKYNIQRIDVNKDNDKALKFYQQFGFEIKSESPFDGFEKPYPILHLKRELLK